ncbi:MTP protein, partial [Amia calva]|nr:MTP protein [Amia calva]
MRSGFSMEAVVQIHSLWRNPSNEQDLLVQIKVNLKVMSNHNGSQSIFMDSSVEELLGQQHLHDLRKPVLIHSIGGKLEDVFAANETNKFILNLKRGLVSVFQMQTYSGTATENDVTGRCKVLYEVSGKQIIKIKDFQSCEKEDFGYTSTNQVFGVNVNGTSKCIYLMENDIIKSVKSEESHLIMLNLKSTIGTKINSRLGLQLLSTKPGVSEILKPDIPEVLAGLEYSYTAVGIHAVPVERRPCFNCSSATDHMKTIKNVDVPKISTTKKFLDLVTLLRDMKKKDIIQMLKTTKYTAVPFLIDAAAAVLTPESLGALSSFLDFTKVKQGPLLERFLYACAFSARPSTYLLSTLTNILSGKIVQKEVQETAIITLGSVIGKMCSANNCTSQEVIRSKNLIVDRLKSSTEEFAVKACLLALKSACLPETIPLILQYTEMSNSVSITALSALQRFPAKYINNEVKEQMRNIFYQRKKHFIETVRLAAAEILLNSDPQYVDIRNIIEAIPREGPEPSRYLSSKIQSCLNSDHGARKIIVEVLKDSNLNNYNHLSRLGSSSTYSGNLTATKDMVTSYNVDFLFSEHGFLRKSNSNFYTYSHGNKLLSVQVSMEAKGLDGLFGEAAEEEEIMAGMSTTLLDVQLRPVVFFQGYADLMEKYWSANGEPQHILMANILPIDHLQVFSLQSGLPVLIHFQGGLTVDVTSSTELSLFSQESKSRVTNRGTLAISGTIEIDASFINVGVETRTEAQTQFVFVNTVRFSEMPVLFCLQMKKEPYPYRESVVVYERFPNGKNFTLQKRRKFTFPGEEVSLHKRNSEMCKKLL